MLPRPGTPSSAEYDDDGDGDDDGGNDEGGDEDDDQPSAEAEAAWCRSTR